MSNKHKDVLRFFFCCCLNFFTGKQTWHAMANCEDIFDDLCTKVDDITNEWKIQSHSFGLFALFGSNQQRTKIWHDYYHKKSLKSSYQTTTTTKSNIARASILSKKNIPYNVFIWP